MSSMPDLTTQSGRLQYARENYNRHGVTFPSIRSAARHFGWNENTYKSHEQGIRRADGLKEEDARKYARAFGVSLAWLLTGKLEAGEPRIPLVPIVGYVGANAEGRVAFADGQDTGDRAYVPPGGSESAVAIEVKGHSMRGIADDGALIYYEERHTKPLPDMIGQVVIVGLRTGEVLVKRLVKGGQPGVYDLESSNAPTIEGAPIEWIAEMTAYIPPRQARRAIVRAGTMEAA